jgi:hypothetical protein
VQVTDGTVITSAFRVARPDGWRVITSPADVPPFVIFVAPDDAALVLVSSSGLDDNPPRPDVSDDTPLETVTQVVTLDDRTVTIYGAGDTTIADVVARVGASLR